MRYSKKSFLAHASIYWVGKMLSRAVSFFLLPIYTAYIKPSEYGVLSILFVTMNMLLLFMSFQLPTAIYRFCAKAITKKEKQQVLSAAFLFSVVTPFILFLPLYFYAEPVAVLLGIGGRENLLRIVLFECQMAIIWGVYLADMRANNESVLYSSLEITLNLTMALLSILLVVGAGMGIKGMVVSQAMTFTGLTVVFSPRFLRRAPISLDFRVLKKMLIFSIPLIPAMVAMAAVHNADRLIVEKMLGIEATGIYAIGYKVGTIVNMVVLGPFLLVWQPKSFDLANKPGFEKKYGIIFTYLAVSASFVALMLSGFSREIVMLMTDRSYWQAHELVPIIAWSYVFFAMANVANAGLLIHEKTFTVFYTVIFIFCLNIGGNLILIPRLGLNGAAFATLASFAVYFILTAWLSYNYVKIEYQRKKLSSLAFLVVSAMVCFFLINSAHLWLRLTGKVATLTGLLIIFYYIDFFPELQLKSLVNRARRAIAGGK